MEIVNPVDPEDLIGWTATLRATFLHEPDPAKAAKGANRWRERLEPGRTWGAREHGRWVATLGSEARSMTVPGVGGTTNDIGIDALTAVSVNATHRRRGALTAMLGASLQAAKERGDALSYLIAAEWPIYGRFGYAPAAQGAHYTYFSRTPGSAIAPTDGTVRQIEPAEAAQIAPAIFARSCRERAGQIERPQRFWDDVFDDEPRDGRSNLIVHDGPDGPDGLLAWQPGRDFDLTGHGSVKVVDLFTATTAAYRNLWAYLSGIDVIDEITLEARPVDEPARWLLPDGRALRATYVGDWTWVCLLDVPAALTARGYDVAGSFALDVVDPSLHGFAAGRYLLDGGPEGSSCTSTTHSADVTLSAQALASAYLGGYRLRGRAVVGDVQEHTPGSVARLDAMLATSLAPYCQTAF